MLKVENLSIRLVPNKVILADINFEAREAEIIGILGPSGAGKTTLFRTIAGLMTSDKGLITLNENELFKFPVAKRPISYLQQSFPLYSNLTVLANVLVAFGKASKNSAKKNEAEALRMLLKLGISEELWQRKPENLSGGETQRVALAKCLLKPCQIMLLDEPFSNIDKNTKRNLMQIIYKTVKEKNIICLFISHDENDLLFMADKLVVMHNGKILQKGTSKELLNAPMSSKVAAIGSVLGMQIITRTELSELNGLGDFKNQSFSNVAKIGWRPNRSKIVCAIDEQLVRSCICVRGRIQRITEIADEIYYGLNITGLSNDRYLWHIEHSNNSCNSSIILGDECILQVDFKDLFFMNQEENVIPMESLA